MLSSHGIMAGCCGRRGEENKMKERTLLAGRHCKWEHSIILQVLYVFTECEDIRHFVRFSREVLWLAWVHRKRGAVYTVNCCKYIVNILYIVAPHPNLWGMRDSRGSRLLPRVVFQSQWSTVETVMSYVYVYAYIQPESRTVVTEHMNHLCTSSSTPKLLFWPTA